MEHSSSLQQALELCLTRHLSVGPSDLDASRREGSERLEDGGRDIDAVAAAARALVHDGGAGGLAVVVNVDLLAAVAVLVRGHGDDGVGVAVGTAAGAKTGVVVGHVAGEGKGRSDKGADSDDHLGDGVHFE